MLKRDSRLEFGFDQYISPGRCSFSSQLSNDAYRIQYERLSETSTKIVLTPVSKWTGGIEKELGIFCRADNGNATENPFLVRYSFADGFRFVANNGNDSNSGLTESEPLASIQTGISRLTGSGDCSNSGSTCIVLVSKGNYSISTSITVANRISLFGSYSNDFLTRNADPLSNQYDPTILADSRSSTGGGISTPISTFTISGNLEKEATEINGFHIKPPTTGSGFSSAIFYTSITGTGIVFRSNRIEIQNPGFPYGAFSDSVNSGEFLSNQIIQTGTYSGTSWNGIYINSTGIAFSKIESNTITMGTCAGVSCIANAIGTGSTGGASSIHKNNITLGNGTGANASINGFFPTASNTSPDMTFSNNTVRGTTCTGNACLVSAVHLNVPGLNSKFSITGNELNPGTCTVGTCETRGIYITGNNTTDVDILSNTISGGDTSATANGSNFGLKVNTGISSFINFQNNKVNTGSSQSGFGISVGLRIGATGGAGIIGNTIVGGSGNLVFALWGAPSSNILIQRNRFEGGNSNSSGNATVDINLGNRFLSNVVIAGREQTGPSAAIKISGGSTQFYHNTIIGRGNGSNTYGIQFSGSNSVDVGYNLIITESGATNRHCVYEDAAGFGPQSFASNALFDCPSSFYFDQDSANNAKTEWCAAMGGTFSNAGCTNQIASPIGTALPNPVNPQFFDSANGKYCLSSSTPATISTGSPTNLVTVDFTGASRPSGNRAYGAYEPNSSCN
ncbi:hypothetical protein [Leptospira ryugenii]|uniref:hypothetical protein n=1 Tax=Leptospira ryugenii TaxID=1917863 RepID=UPI00107FA1B1|nr:hypothetical protein [Leptospira ryugenii]